jgi:hypothetical protein
MILPTKHMSLSNSLLSIGAVLLKHIDNNHTVTALWNTANTLPEVKTFERFTLGLDLLFMMGAVEFHDGLLRRASK